MKGGWTCPACTANREAVTAPSPDYPAVRQESSVCWRGQGLTVFLRSVKSKHIKIDFCRAVLLLLFCSWSEVTRQLLFCPQCQVVPGGEHSSHLLIPLGLSPRALQGCSSLTCSKGGREKHQVQTHRQWAEPLYSAPAAL